MCTSKRNPPRARPCVPLEITPWVIKRPSQQVFWTYWARNFRDVRMRTIDNEGIWGKAEVQVFRDADTGWTCCATFLVKIECNVHTYHPNNDRRGLKATLYSARKTIEIRWCSGEGPCIARKWSGAVESSLLKIEQMSIVYLFIHTSCMYCLIL